jgi:transcription elongation GreA/GreB family factor
MYESSTENLREKIKELKKELEKVTFEKGLIAEENKDLRENSAYDYWDQKETNLIIRIHRIMKEISERLKKEISTVRPKKAKKNTEKKQFDVKPHKWL